MSSGSRSEDWNAGNCEGASSPPHCSAGAPAAALLGRLPARMVTRFLPAGRSMLLRCFELPRGRAAAALFARALAAEPATRECAKKCKQRN